MENQTLATEILHELKLQSRRYFIMLIITIIVLFASNIIWLYAWNHTNHIKTPSYNISGQDNANAVYNTGVGGVNINGEKENK